jgi:hypothetical protein
VKTALDYAVDGDAERRLRCRFHRMERAPKVRYALRLALLETI